ncbi:hypothetical protein AJ80_00294 [Polytolypa hystricis UAMH7299]|uniref:Uncharacterized protein n=1 Tax=Polytolypa hystricis (strain UAMH7299) TaxID=1447883 RepID=A0A2B7Z474_POLH7|nr:hypothetical protein AJ80_00294 [Polytolypa hystricis UAMH7299]
MSTSTDGTPAQLIPGRGIGFLTLGSSLHEVLTRLKAYPQTYPSIDVAYSAPDPLLKPVLVNLPGNGLRLRFDGADQRLRLIEVLDFTKIPLVYKNHEVAKPTRPDEPVQGPAFRHVYNRLFGPSYPGEYIPAPPNKTHGTYVLSYPGVAFSFPLLQSAWSDQCDFVALMSSSAASSATSMAVFHGPSWPEARTTLLTHDPQSPKSTDAAGKNKDFVSDDVEEVKVHGAGRIEVVRRSGSSFWINLSETTPQDLVAELGPPDAIYRKHDRRISIHRDHTASSSRQTSTSRTRASDPTEIDPFSESSATEESDEEGSPTSQDSPSALPTECFYNYFHHGFDALIAPPSAPGPQFPGTSSDESPSPVPDSPLTVTKVLVHGNVPGSYPFNRYRRCRWKLIYDAATEPLTSETPYQQVSETLKELWRGSYASAAEEAAHQRGMVLNRGWGDSPGSSVELLGGWEESSGGRAGVGDDGSQLMGNTELFGFPGLLFEVLKNGAVSCLTVF